MIERVIEVKRVAKVVKGGKRMKISSTVVVGDGKGKVGVGHGKAQEVALAVRKATTRAQKEMAQISVSGDTIPHPAAGKYSSSKVLLRPASSGTGLIACPQVRAVLEAAGLKDVLTKAFGSRNPHNLAVAALRALQSLRTIRDVAQVRNKSIGHFVERKHEEIASHAQEEPDRPEAVS
ncbi:MAG: 30S ribosomal protein S5 [candidate division WOR-3 bacterium]